MAKLSGDKSLGQTVQNLLDSANNKLGRLCSVFRDAIDPEDVPNSVAWQNGHRQSGGAYLEYLLKSWIQSGRKQDNLMDALVVSTDRVIQRLVRVSPGQKLTYVTVMNENGVADNKMHQHTCYFGILLYAALKMFKNNWKILHRWISGIGRILPARAS